MQETADNEAIQAKKGISLPSMELILVIGIVALLAINAVMLFLIQSNVQGVDSRITTALQPVSLAVEKAELASEQAKLPELSVIELNDPACNDCIGLSGIVSGIRQAEADFSGSYSLDYRSQEAEELILKYSIKSVPTIIVVGDTLAIDGLQDSWAVLGSVEDDGALVLRNLSPVYLDLASNAYVGRVTLTRIVDETCTECAQTLSLANFRAAGITVSSEQTIDLASDEAGELIEAYGITKVPAVTASAELSDYPNLRQTLEGIGSFESDGVWVYRDVFPIYLDLETGVLRGKTNATVLTRALCSECFDANQLLQSLKAGFGFVFESEQVIDASTAEGAGLIADHNITKLPTMIITGDTLAYPSVAKGWPELGSTEADGTLVFNSFDSLQGQTYFDLETGETITVGG